MAFWKALEVVPNQKMVFFQGSYFPAGRYAEFKQIERPQDLLWQKPLAASYNQPLQLFKVFASGSKFFAPFSVFPCRPSTLVECQINTLANLRLEPYVFYQIRTMMYSFICVVFLRFARRICLNWCTHNVDGVFIDSLLK